MMMNKISHILLIIGGLNLGLIGITGLFGDRAFDFVEWLFSELIPAPVLIDIVWIIVGIAAVQAITCMCKK